MKDDIGKVIGIVRARNKDDKPITKLFLVGEHEDYVVESSEKIEGKTVVEAYINGAVEVNMNQTVKLVWGKGYQGKAVIRGVDVIQ